MEAQLLHNIFPRVARGGAAVLLGRWTWAVDLHPPQITSASQGFQPSAHPPSNLSCPEKQELTSSHAIQAAAAFFPQHLQSYLLLFSGLQPRNLFDTVL